MDEHPPGASDPSSLHPTHCKVEYEVAELPGGPASDSVRKENAAFCEAFSKAIWTPHWTEVKFDGEAAAREGPVLQQLSELSTVNLNKLEIIDMCKEDILFGEDIRGADFGEVIELSFENEYLYLLRNFNWLSNVKCVHSVTSRTCHNYNSVRKKGRTRCDRKCQPKAV